LEAFLEGHCRAFRWLGGVPAECVYDNPKTAVVRILAGPQRQEHVLFASLRAHYLFDSQFCRPGAGHEKGAVENLVGYVRRNALVPVPDYPSWDALNAHLLAWCERERERLAPRGDADQAALRPLPQAPFASARPCLLPVNRLSLVTVDHNRYSVPCRYVGHTLRGALFTTRLELWAAERRVAEHPRDYGRGQTHLQLEHYLPALARKPHAATHAAVIGQLPPIYATVRDQLCARGREGYREFVALLLLHQEFPAAAVTAALETAWQQGRLHAPAVRQLLLNQTAPPPPPPTPVPPALAHYTLPPPDLSAYDALLVGGRA
jgi:hypothetical protein